MIVLSGADLVLPDRILTAGTLTIDDGRITSISAEPQGPSSPFAFHGHTIVPGFIDVHVHGVGGVDTLDEGNAIHRIAQLLPRYGVTAFCPTTVACAPGDLRRVLDQVRDARETPRTRAARVLPAHLESNFINPDYRGAQPLSCLRRPTDGTAAGSASGADDFSATDILHVIEACSPDVAVVTLAPEIDGGIALIPRLSALGIRVSLGHSGATCDEGTAAIAAGARRATHLFNRMPPMHHRSPGLAGAVLQSDDVAVEVICDGVHVDPALVRIVVSAKGPSRVMAISDGTAAAALAPGQTARLGGRTILAAGGCALLEDGTMAGSVLTMDKVFRNLTVAMGFSLLDAVTMCSTTPARELGLIGHGVIAPGMIADLTVLTARLEVTQTWIGGQQVWTSSRPAI
jgi:N-acetylglucosamine-6-phosphate deacetylase